MASDGSIKIEISVDGKEVKVASKELDNLEASAGSVGKGIKSAESSMDGLADSSDKAGKSVKGAKESIDGVGQGTTKASISLKDLAVSLGLVAVASAAFNTLKASMDGAIARFDTLNSFPKVLEALGVSAEDSERAINNLSEGIDGLPTTLDDISSSAQQMYNSFKDVDKTTDTALALNNALLASGSAGEKAKRGTDQYIKALQTGQINMDTWNTLQETMGIGLTKLADEFGYVGASAENDLYQALKNGEVTFDQFNSKLIELGTGTGELAELAKTNSLGIATSLGNLKNAAARGIADIIASFNKLSEDVTNKGLAENIDTLKHIVNASFKAIGSAIEATAPVVMAFSSALQASLPVIKALTPALIGLGTAYAIHATVNTLSTAIKANTTIMAIAAVAKNAYTIATNRLTLAVTLAAVRMKIVGVAMAAYNSIVALSTTVQASFVTGLTLANVASLALSGAITVLGTALKVMMGPIGWVTLAIGALVGAVIGIVKWFNRSSEEGKKMLATVEEMGESTKKLTDEVKNNSTEYEKQRAEMNASIDSSQRLAKEVEELAAKENKSAGEKQILTAHIERLNESVEGLNLAYNEEANALNLSSEEISKRIDLLSEQTSFNDALERQMEIEKEQAEVVELLRKNNEERAIARGQMEELDVKSKEYAETVKILDEQEEALTETLIGLTEEWYATDEQIQSSSEVIAQAIENQITSYEDLNEAQQSAFDSIEERYNNLSDAATNAFEKINSETKLTIEEIFKNQQHNLEQTEKYGENMARLYDHAGKSSNDNFIEWLNTLGIDSAAEVAVMASMTDAELDKYVDMFDKQMDSVGKATKQSLGEGLDDAVDAVVDFVEKSKTTLEGEIKAAGFDEIGKAVPEGYQGGVEKGTPDAVNAVGEMAGQSIDEAKDVLQVNSPSKEFTTIGESVPEGMTLGINNGTPEAIAAAKKLAMELLKPFDKTPDDFKQIGKEAMAGFNSGLNAGKAQVLSTVKIIADQAAQTMRKALDIHSPSRVTRKIGNETGEGLNLGIKDKQKDVNATSEKMAKSVAAIIESMNDSIKIDTTKHNAEIKQIEKRAKEDINAINAKAAKGKRKLTEAETIRIRRINEDASKKIVSIEEKMAKEREKVAADSSKNLIAIAEKYVKDKRFAGEMSLKDEGHFWNQMYKNAEYGSEEYEKAMQNHQNVVKKMRSEVERVNEEYSKRILDIDKKLVDETKKLNDEYNQAYSKRVDDLLNVAGLLDEFVEKDGVSGYQLIQNLQSQVNALEEFSLVMESLGNRIDNDALFEELQALGPKSIAELRELNSMSEEELVEFTRLYERRFQLARDQANKELEPLKDDITHQIKDLNEASQKELSLVEKEWKKSIEKIVLGTQKEFDSMNQVGKDAMKGLEGGILSMESTLMATAKRIANSIRATMQSALDINSPSKVMEREVGRWIPEGIAIGIKKNASSVYRELENMANNMIVPASPERALGAFKKQGFGGYGIGNNSSKTSYDHSKKMENHINIETKDSGVEELERVIRRLQFGL